MNRVEIVDNTPACIGYGIRAHHAVNVTENERLCSECFAALMEDVTAGKPLRGAWRPGGAAEGYYEAQ